MSKVEIYYFTGSGNSLHIAKELQKRIPDAELIPVVRLLYKETIESDAETVGLVFPIHGMTFPIPIKNFLKKLKLKSVKYTFAVSTRAGTKNYVFDRIRKILKRKGQDLDSHFSLTMVSNDSKFQDYKVPTEENLAKVEAAIKSKLDTICEIIINKEKNLEKDDFHVPSGFLLDRLVLLGMFFVEKTGANDYFYSNSRCTGCGTCEKVCPSRKIKMTDKKPVWQSNVKCYFCYACINYCPVQASQIKSKWYMKSFTEKTGRYSHPYATANDIAEQK